MKAFLDYVFRLIDSKQEELRVKADAAEDEQNTAVHYAKQGARISQGEWEHIDALQSSIRNEQSAWTFLSTELKKEHIPRNSDKSPHCYIEVINERIIPKLAEKGPDQYGSCALLQKFVAQLEQELEWPQQHEHKRRICLLPTPQPEYSRKVHHTIDAPILGDNIESFELNALDLLTSIEVAATEGRLSLQERHNRMTGARGLIIVETLKSLVIGELLWSTPSVMPAPDDPPDDWSDEVKVVHRGHWPTKERFDYLDALAKRKPELSVVVHAGPVGFVSTVAHIDGHLSINYLARLFLTEGEISQWTGGAPT